MKSSEVYQNSYKHEELKAAAIRHCRAKQGDHFRSIGGFTPAGRVVMGQHGAVTAMQDIHGFGFAQESEFAANASIEVDGERIQVMARIEGGEIKGDFFARKDGGFYCGNSELAKRPNARQIGCFGRATNFRITASPVTGEVKI